MERLRKREKDRKERKGYLTGGKKELELHVCRYKNTSIQRAKISEVEETG